MTRNQQRSFVQSNVVECLCITKYSEPYSLHYERETVTVSSLVHPGAPMVYVWRGFGRGGGAGGYPQPFWRTPKLYKEGGKYDAFY